MSKPVVQRYMPQVPDGWVKCPRFGDPRWFDGLNIIPCKVPLSHAFDQKVGPSGRWTLVDAIKQFRGYGMEVATVIDLTKSRNYYNFVREMEELGDPPNKPPIAYIKIECRGRGEAPQPAEVNEAVWHIFTHHAHPETANKYILLHCTHGFNRTGFITVAALMRLRRDRGLTVKRSLKRFAASRPPGIYKDHYIQDLFKYYHEARDPSILTPAVPRWKGDDDADDAADAANEDAGGEDGEQGKNDDAGARPVVRHEDIWSIGERICRDEEEFIKQQICALLPFDGGRRDGPPGQLRFPGMQPVSLSLDRMRDLENHWYHVTWKADGTRYMVFVLAQGTYVIDRSFNIVRCEMRFHNAVKHPAKPRPGQPPPARIPYPVGKPMNLTLLDGEMVVDVDPGSGQQRLRYLIYDACMINSTPIIHEKWIKRYLAIEDAIVAPRTAERDYINKCRMGVLPRDQEKRPYISPPYEYHYAAEPFSVRRKPFWPVYLIDKVFESFNDPHKVGHESDGLILQGCDHPYKAGTCELLYKWKFAHMNSVDFLLRCATVSVPPGEGGEGGAGQVRLDSSAAEPLELFLLDQTRSRNGNIVYVPLAKVDPDGHYRVEFPPDVDPLTYDGKLVECTFDRDRGVWLFMRERRDKDTPNGSKVYLRIKESIVNHVDQELLVGTLKDALLHRHCYQRDLEEVSRNNPALLEATRRDLNEWAAKMQGLEEQRRAQQRAQLPPPPAGPRPPGSRPPGRAFPPASSASPPPGGYFDGDGEGHGGDGGGFDNAEGVEGYRVSEADPDAVATTGGGGGAKRQRAAAWGEGAEGNGDGGGFGHRGEKRGHGMGPVGGVGEEEEEDGGGGGFGGGEEPRQGQGADRRVTHWPPDHDLPSSVCPAYEGYGYD